ncbi:radical SAM protein [Streptomyces niveus]
MTVADWRRVIGELRGMGVRNVQFIGGEPTLHPALPELIRHAIANGMRIEVFSNLSHVGEAVWAALRIPGVRLAFSYYSDTPADHDDVTMTRGSHARTPANVAKARSLGIPLRGSVIGVLEGQRGTQARGDPLQLGVRDVRTDRIRPFGRGADGRDPRMDRLCGRCGRGEFAVAGRLLRTDRGRRGDRRARAVRAVLRPRRLGYGLLTTAAPPCASGSVVTDRCIPRTGSSPRHEQ